MLQNRLKPQKKKLLMKQTSVSDNYNTLINSNFFKQSAVGSGGTVLKERGNGLQLILTQMQQALMFNMRGATNH